jgi:hypothetical protein
MLGGPGSDHGWGECTDEEVPIVDVGMVGNFREF